MSTCVGPELALQSDELCLEKQLTGVAGLLQHLSRVRRMPSGRVFCQVLCHTVAYLLAARKYTRSKTLPANPTKCLKGYSQT